MVKVKICGITNLEDALSSIEAGCDALGFVFYRKSSRYISPVKAKDIITKLPSRVVKIGIFADAKEKTIKRIAKFCKLDMLQFHGKESPSFCARFKKYKIIKTFRVKGKLDHGKIMKYRPFAYLFDTFVPSTMGGTGKKFNWKLIRHLNHIEQPVFLSGGLTCANVRQAIRAVRPSWVDVSSSVEKLPGKKHHKKVQKFIKAVKG